MAGLRFRISSGFQWTATRTQVAVGLAKGFTQERLAQEHKITSRAIRKWLAEREFREEVDRLSLMIGIANRAERLRIANRVIQQMVGEKVDTERDILDWLKFAQSETDGNTEQIVAAFAELLGQLTDRGETTADSEASAA